MNEKTEKNLASIKGVIDHLGNALESREERNIDDWQINIKAAGLAFNKIDLCALGKCQGLGTEINQKLQMAFSECEQYAQTEVAARGSVEDQHEVFNKIETHVQTAITKARELHAACLAAANTQDGPGR